MAKRAHSIEATPIFAEDSDFVVGHELDREAISVLVDDLVGAMLRNGGMIQLTTRRIDTEPVLGIPTAAPIAFLAVMETTSPVERQAEPAQPAAEPEPVEQPEQDDADLAAIPEA